MTKKVHIVGKERIGLNVKQRRKKKVNKRKEREDDKEE